MSPSKMIGSRSVLIPASTNAAAMVTDSTEEGLQFSPGLDAEPAWRYALVLGKAAAVQPRSGPRRCRRYGPVPLRRKADTCPTTLS